MSGHGHFHWNELMTRDAENAKRFYGDTLGWTFQPFSSDPDAPTYWVCMEGETPVGGIFPMQGDQCEDEPEHWMGYISVDDVDARVGKAASAGATILRPPFDVPMVGRVALLEDPGGAKIGWITPAQQG